ncbi:MAG TPA: uracil-DNA glycosylase [Candidatus Acidoferrales bacterium]|nr:uracil-DNA glycosylase [Candidatus Acidoferrales bacterium]
MGHAAAWTKLYADIVGCRRCRRLVAYREQVARAKRRAYRDWEYWGKPLPGFGDRAARLVVIGLAPAAHGGNRTGRIFTGDRSGDWLYATLHRFGFANQPTSTKRDDGLRLTDAYVSAAARCAPPDNKPTAEEFANCRPFLQRELEHLRHKRVIVALGRVAFDAYLAARRASGHAVPERRARFAHGAVFQLPDVTLIASYHPSQRNTQTGFLTAPMFDKVFAAARRLLSE